MIECHIHIKHEVLDSTLPKDLDSPWFLWKIFSLIYINSYNAHVAFLLFHWFLIFHSVTDKITFNSYVKHSLPLVILVVDSLFDYIEIVRNHWFLAIAYSAIYTNIFDLLLTTGKAIYDLANLETPNSCAYVIFIIL